MAIPGSGPFSALGHCAGALELAAGSLSGVGGKALAGEGEGGARDSLKPGGHSVLPCGLSEGEPPPRPTPQLQAEEPRAWRQDGCGLHLLLLCSGRVCLSPHCLGPALFPPWPLSTWVLGQWPPPWGESPSYHSYFRGECYHGDGMKVGTVGLGKCLLASRGG